MTNHEEPASSCFERSEACDPGCPGWVVSHSDSGRGFGVEACDECARFSRDEEAEAHTRSCRECFPNARSQWAAVLGDGEANQ